MPPNAVRALPPPLVVRLAAAQLVVGVMQDFAAAQIQRGMVGMAAVGGQHHVAALEAV